MTLIQQFSICGIVIDESRYLALDVQYSPSLAFLGGVLFARNSDPGGVEFCLREEIHSNYLSGEFYRRELPVLLSAINALPSLPKLVLIDGYVWLGLSKTPGLGSRLYQALGERVPIIGVAKTRFFGTPTEAELLRGRSVRPLFVTTCGIPHSEALSFVAQMSGRWRIPTILARVDNIARQAARSYTATVICDC
jgi:deoxyribonuclease V